MTKINEDYVLDDLSNEEIELLSDEDIEEYAKKIKALDRPEGFCKERFKETITMCPFSKNARRRLGEIYKCNICPKNPEIKK